MSAHLDPGLHSVQRTPLHQCWTELVEEVGKKLEASPALLLGQSQHLPCLAVEHCQGFCVVGVLDAVSDHLLIV